MKNKNWREGWLILGLLGVILYRALPDWWNLIAFIPIIVGFRLYYRR